MRSILLTSLAVLAFLLPLSTTSQENAHPVEPVTVILVRHADTDSPERDPELTAEGKERAQALPGLLSESGATHLFSTQFIRTRTTLAPLAEATGIEVEVIPAQEGERQLDLLRDLPPGSVAVVAGHSNTVPGMAKALGTEPRDLEEHERYGGMIPHDAFDRVFMITLPAGEGAAAKLVELRY